MNVTLGPFSLDALQSEVERRFPNVAKVKKTFAVYGTWEAEITTDGKLRARILAKPVNPVKMPRDIGRQVGPMEYRLQLIDVPTSSEF